MTFYALFSRPERCPEAITAIKQRFFWTAFLFTPVWAIVQRAWGFLLLWGVVLALSFAIEAFFGSGVGGALYLLFALWSGFAAPQIAERSLFKRGWLAHGLLTAPDRETAETLWLQRHYGARP